MDDEKAMTGRMGWMDAVRGVSMILVVWHHFMTGAYAGMVDFVVDALAAFRLPLFFFVSGFFAWKAPERWTAGRRRDIVRRKARTQLFGMAVFYVLWQWRCGESVMDFTRIGFVWYWFTVALFQMFVVYIALVWLARRMGSERVVWIGLGAVTAVSLAMLAFVGNMSLAENHFCRVLSIQKSCNYFQFFVLGLAVRRFWPEVEKMLSGRLMFAVSLVAFIGVFAVCQIPGLKDFTHMGFQILHDLVLRYAGLIMVVSGFFALRRTIDGPGPGARGLRFVGRRTLDVYFLHYFFLPMPATMPSVVGLLHDIAFGQAWIALIVGLVVSVAVSALCLAVGAAIRRSRVLGAWLLGAR